MPPKRGPPSDHPNAQIGRKRIRTRTGGKKLVEQTIRNNVLLFLQKLTDEETTDTAGPSFNGKLSSAVSGALDPLVGPEAAIDLSSYDGFADDPTIFANRDAGQLMATLLTLMDGGEGGAQALAGMQKRLDDKDQELQTTRERKEQVKNTLAYFQTLIPLEDDGQKEFLKQLRGLASDIENAGWLYGILWTSCLQWMDARLRQIRSYGFATNNHFTQRAPPQPQSWEERSQMINIRIHGGDLRVDAVMCAIKFGDIRHNDANYDVFLRDSFKRMYNLSASDGLWLAKNGHTASRKVDWPRIIGIIDKFVALSDRLAVWNLPPRSKKLPNNFKLAHSNTFKAFTDFVSDLIFKVEADVNWTAEEPEQDTLHARFTALQTDILMWKEDSKSRPEWEKMAIVSTPWPPANYLRDLNTPATRTVGRHAGPDAGPMDLRPQPRVDYSKCSK